MSKRKYVLKDSGDAKDGLILFLVQGSAPEPYNVVFRRRDPQNLSAYCTCPAGENGMYCKHRIRILQGLVDGIVSENVEEVQRVVDWVVGTDVEQALRAVCDLEQEMDRLKKTLSHAKYSLARCFLD